MFRIETHALCDAGRTTGMPPLSLVIELYLALSVLFIYSEDQLLVDFIYSSQFSKLIYFSSSYFPKLCFLVAVLNLRGECLIH